MKKAIVVSNSITSIASFLQDQSAVESEALAFRDTSQLPLTKKEAEELPSPDWPPEPASCLPVRRHYFVDITVPQGSMGEFAAESNRQIGSAKYGFAYASMLAGQTSLQQPHGPYKPQARIQLTLNAQPLGACCSETCMNLCVACLMAPL